MLYIVEVALDNIVPFIICICQHYFTDHYRKTDLSATLEKHISQQQSIIQQVPEELVLVSSVGRAFGF